MSQDALSPHEVDRTWGLRALWPGSETRGFFRGLEEQWVLGGGKCCPCHLFSQLRPGHPSPEGSQPSRLEEGSSPGVNVG